MPLFTTVACKEPFLAMFWQKRHVYSNTLTSTCGMTIIFLLTHSLDVKESFAYLYHVLRMIFGAYTAVQSGSFNNNCSKNSDWGSTISALLNRGEMVVVLVAIFHNIFEFCIIRIFWSGTLYYSKVPRGVSWSRTFRYSTSQHWFENIKKFHQISEYSDIACMGAPFKNASWCIFFFAFFS